MHRNFGLGRTYSNKQQTESQKNAIEQFAKAKKN